jgi:hypothetical protein
MGKMFARGYEASRAEKKRQDENRENSGKKLWRFFLKNDGDEADVRFLTEEPVCFYEHNVRRGDRYEQITCTGDDNTCPYCLDGDRPTYKGAYLIIDRREYEYTDKNGNKKTGKNQIRLYVQGMRVISQLDRIHEKYGLSNRDVTIVRLGKGTSTTYTVERGEKEELSEEEIKNLLPENIRDQYDGTADSLMNIVEEQLKMSMPDNDSDDDEEDEDDVEETTSGRDKLVSLADDDEEEEAPKHKLSAKGGMKSKFKKAQNSVKPRAKSLLKSKA